MTYIFLAPGFEEIEALTPLDILRRAGVEVKTVGIGGKAVVGSHGIAVEADLDESQFDDAMPDMVILPGGMPGTTNLLESQTVLNAIQNAVRCNALIGAICAALDFSLLIVTALCGKEKADELYHAVIADR